MKKLALVFSLILVFTASLVAAESGSFYDPDWDSNAYWSIDDDGGVSVNYDNGVSEYYAADGSYMSTFTDSEGTIWWADDEGNSGSVETRNNSSKRSSSRSSSSSSKKSSTYVAAANAAAVTNVTPYEATVRTNGGDLNLRAQPNKGATILVKLANRATLTVTGYTGEWLKVTAAGKSGFVPARYVDTSNAPAANNNTTATAASGTATEYYALVNPTNNFVNMRSGPSKSSSVVNIYYYGYQLKVLSENGDWCQVLDENTGVQGYMMKGLLLYAGPVDENG